jgi:hypothetical protein
MYKNMVYHKIYFKGSSSLLNHLHMKKAYYRHHHVNRQTNKEIQQRIFTCIHVEEDLVDCFRITRVMFNFGCNQKVG